MIPFPSQSQGFGPFVSRLAIAITALAAVVLLWLLSEAALILFASILVAVALCGLAKLVTRFVGVPYFLSLLIVTFVLFALIALPVSLFGSHLLAQYDAIAVDIPKAVSSIQQSVEAHPWGRFIEGVIAGADFSNAAAPVTMHVASLISSVSKVLTYMILTLFGGLYLAIDPDRYLNGLIYFTPIHYRRQVQRFLDRSGSSLRIWLFTQLLVVIMNGVFAGVGLWALGVDAPLALAMLGGALSFVPYAGTIVAMAIAGLASLPQGAVFALYAVAVFAAASFLEGYLITPYIQSKTLSLPPVVLIFSMLAFTLLFGALGVILAAPLTVVLMVAVEILTTEDPNAAEV